MSVFLTELGKHLAARWAAVLMLPGAVFAGAVVVASVLGHGHALDAGLLRTRAEAWASASGGAVAVAVVALVVVATAAGCAAVAIGRAVVASWGFTGAGPVLRPLVALRRRRWRTAAARADAAVRDLFADLGDERARARARRAVLRRDAVCLVEPDRPTWAGDRLRAADERLHRSCRLDLPVVWPRLWLVLPDAARAELVAVQDGAASAARSVGWALLHLLLGLFWWPSAVVGAVSLFAARQRVRRSVAVYAELAESAVDVYGRDLAVQLGLDWAQRVTPEVGEEITAILRKPGTETDDQWTTVLRAPGG